MAVTNTPAFTQSPLLSATQITVANTGRDGATGTYSTPSVAAGANGTLIDYIRFQAIATTAAGSIRIFFSADNSTNWRLLAEVVTAGVTPSGTVGAEKVIWIPDVGVPLNIPSGSGIRFCVNNSETWNAFVHGGNL